MQNHTIGKKIGEMQLNTKMGGDKKIGCKIAQKREGVQNRTINKRLDF